MQVAPLPRRLSLALAASAFVHAAVLANAPFAPGLGEVAPFAGKMPLTARLASVPSMPLPLVPEPPPPGPDPKPVAAIPPVVPLSQAAGLPSAEIYFRGSELDDRATPLNEVNLVYPEPALSSGQSGVVTLRLKIDHQGVLRDAAVLDAQPSGVFESAALEAVQALKFRPAKRNGVPVGSVKTIEVPFHPDCTRTGTCIAGPQDKAGPR